MQKRTAFLALALVGTVPGLTSCAISPTLPSFNSTSMPTVTVTKEVKVPVTKEVIKVVKVPAPTVTTTVRGPLVVVEKTTETKTVVKWKPGMPQSCWNVVQTTLEMEPEDIVITDSAGKILTALDGVNTSAYLHDYKTVNNLIRSIYAEQNKMGTAYTAKAKQIDYLTKQIKQCRAETKP